jgi:phytoene dehydrogenase-like protein
VIGDSMNERTSNPPGARRHVAVVGGGLAGLVAACAAAQAGAAVTLLEAARAPGGRARTGTRDGFAFNQGPHALYRAGPGMPVLHALGVTPDGAPPPLPGVFLAGDWVGPTGLLSDAARVSGDAAGRRAAGDTAADTGADGGAHADAAGVAGRH